MTKDTVEELDSLFALIASNPISRAASMEQSLRNSLAEQLTAILAESGMTDRQCARKMKVPVAELRQLLTNDDYDPSLRLRVLCRFASVMGRELQVVIGDKLSLVVGD